MTDPARVRTLRALVPTSAPLMWQRSIGVRFEDCLPAPNGDQVHAASDIRRRRVLLDRSLLAQPAELRRIAVHEAFHFVWIRLGNPTRRSFEKVLAAEHTRSARGELGLSAEVRKQRLCEADVRNRTRAWREYACESFCDTAAWLYARAGRHREFTLAERFCRQRTRWFEHQLKRTEFLI
ncbi:MAG: hypothetical protein R2762_02680 [Bryobacteraceae bacterium]